MSGTCWDAQRADPTAVTPSWGWWWCCPTVGLTRSRVWVGGLHDGGCFDPDPWFFPSWESSDSPTGTSPWTSMSSEVVEDEFEFYSKAEKYWKDVPATVDGMLGGYGHISSIDINSSRKFLQRFLRVGKPKRGAPKAPFLLLAWSWAFPFGLLLLGCLAGQLAQSLVVFVPRMAPTGRGRPALWTAGRASAASPSGCCCPSSRRWTWWT